MAAIGRCSTLASLMVKVLQSKSSISYRFFSVVPKTDDDIVKKVFTRQQKKFRLYLEDISKVKFGMDYNEQHSIRAYYEVQARIRENLGIPSFAQKTANLLENATEGAPNVRSILVLNKSLRHEVGIEDDMGADNMMFKALAKVEKSIGKPLRREDANGISMWKKEIDGINRKLKIKDEDLEMLEKEAEFAIARAELEEFRNVAFDKIDNIKWRDDIKVDVSMSDIDHRTYL